MFDIKLILLCLLGSGTGYAYGLMFMYNKQRALSLANTSPRLLLVGLGVLRFGLLIAFLVYLLRMEMFRSILTLLSFLVTFWLIIIQKGLMHHEGHRAHK